MSTDQTNAYQRVMLKRAWRLGISIEKAEQEPVAKSRYLAAAEAAAARLDVEPKNVFEEDRQRLENSNYPTAECITPDDVEDLVEALGAQNLGIDELNSLKGRQVVASLWSKQMAHLATCDACQTLLNACRPSAALRVDFQKQVQKKFPLVAARG
jgi:hypothetical protein